MRAALITIVALFALQQLAAQQTIVVTARKRAENVENVPVAVTVESADKLDDEGATDLADLQKEVPNLAIAEGRNQSSTATVFLRGIGQVDPLWGVDPGVGIYLDDVYLARPQGALLDLFDVERIEVLRGPQGTLYGKNTIGGAIKYVTRPISDDFDGRVALTPGSHKNFDVRASLGGALIPGTLRGRMAFASFHHTGYGMNLFTGRSVSDRDTTAARGAVEWIPATDTRVTLSADYTDDKGEPKGYRRLAANPFCPQFLGTTCAPLDSRFDTQSGLEPLNGTRSHGASAAVTSGAFKSITAYRQSDTDNNIDFDTTPARIADVIGTLFDRQFSEELQYAYAHGRWNGVAGAYYFNGAAGGLVRNIFLNSQFTTSNGKTLTDSIAVFGDGTYRLSSRANLNAGLRVTREKKNGMAFNGVYTNDRFTMVRTVTADYDKTKTFDSVAPRIGVDYQVAGRTMAYFTLSRGFKSGGFNIRAQANIFPQSVGPFKDEKLDIGELGVKSVLNDGRVLVNADAFYGKYRDIQVSTFTAYDSNGDGVDDAFFGNFLNAGNATIRGVELEFDASSRTIPWLGVSGFGGWLNATPDEFLDRNHDGFVDTQVIMNAPRFTGSLNVNVHVPVRGGVITASAGAAYRGYAIVTNEGGEYPGKPGVPLLPISQDAYTTYDAWVSWLSADARWRLAVNGKNLTDKAYLVSGYNVPALGVLLGSYGAPRTVTATVEYRFF